MRKWYCLVCGEEVEPNEVLVCSCCGAVGDEIEEVEEDNTGVCDYACIDRAGW